MKGRTALLQKVSSVSSLPFVESARVLIHSTLMYCVLIYIFQDASVIFHMTWKLRLAETKSSNILCRGVIATRYSSVCFVVIPGAFVTNCEVEGFYYPVYVYSTYFIMGKMTAKRPEHAAPPEIVSN